MSVTGALVEGAALPDVGALVQLVRGSLIVHALVVWLAGGQCGLKFSGSVDVQEWRAGPVNGEQERVDEVVRLVKAGAVPLPVAPLAPAGPAQVGRLRARLRDDLRRACELLDDLGSALASDPGIVERHGPKLQNLDIAMQVIAAVEAGIAEQGDLTAISVKLLGLRRSAAHALRRRI
nr:hypothetical protein [Sphingomonas sp.]